MAVLVDSNVLFDLLLDDQVHAEWSEEQIRHIGNYELLVINPVILAEVSIAFGSYQDLELALPSELFVREDLPWEAAFLAGRCFAEYKRLHGRRRSPLPDFYIGAHATIRGHRVLTRDPKRFRHYFPRLGLIIP